MRTASSGNGCSAALRRRWRSSCSKTRGTRSENRPGSRSNSRNRSEQRARSSASPRRRTIRMPSFVIRGMTSILIDREPISGSINPGDRFVDGNGFPWALLVPSDWEHPAEGRRIDSDEWYPRFTNWRESEGEDHTDWYNFRGEPWEPAPENRPPYPVTGETQTADIPGLSTRRDQFISARNRGDRRTGRSRRGRRGLPIDVLSLPIWSSIRRNRARDDLRIYRTTRARPSETVVVEFWSEDEHGADTRDQP